MSTVPPTRPVPPVRPVVTMPVITSRVVLRVVLVIVGVALALYLVYLLRRPIGLVGLAVFLAIALAGPVNRLSRHMPRGAAIATVLLSLLAVPFLLAAAIVPPIVSEADDLVRDLPRYAKEAQEFVQSNERLRKLEADYEVVEKIQEEAAKAPARIGDAAGILRDVGLGLVNSIFTLVTVIVLAAFLLGSGQRWIDMGLSQFPPERAARLRRVSRRIGSAVGGYVAGALCIAAIAGFTSFIVLTVLGVPFAPALAVMAGAFSLIPLIGATIAAAIIAVVTLFENFPTATIVWVIWAVIYQQVENYVIQPQIQKRTVNVQPFVVLVAVLFGSALLGILGALIAIPIAASIQVALREYFEWRRDQIAAGVLPPADATEVVLPPAAGPPPPSAE